MIQAPLFNALINHKKLNYISFHTPGHKNSNKIFDNDLLSLDYTELPDTDSLYEANSVIKDAEDLAAQLYGAKRTLFSAGGCSLCIQTMLKLALPYGGKVLASRMIHKSAVNTLALLNANPIWLMPKIDKINGNLSQINPADIEFHLSRNADISCVYITSPDYYGQIADIKNISKICKKYNVTLLVDNAHGTHFKFLSKDIHPITLGADMCADSAHKTLPVLTGGALLHIAKESYISSAKSAMSIFGSTSPSYPIMASIDICIAWLKKYGKTAYTQLEKDISEIKDIASKKGILDAYSNNTDPIRLTLNTAKIGLSGTETLKYFEENEIEPEFADDERVVFIATPMNSKKELTKLSQVIEKIPVKSSIKTNYPILSIPTLATSLHEALFSPSEHIKVTDAQNRICAEVICPCPPGIPILLPGERINNNSIKKLLHYGILSIDVLK